MRRLPDRIRWIDFSKGNGEFIALVITIPIFFSLMTYFIAFMQFSFASNALSSAASLAGRLVAVQESEEDAQEAASKAVLNSITNQTIDVDTVTVTLEDLTSDNWASQDVIKVTVTADLTDTFGNVLNMKNQSASTLVTLENIGSKIDTANLGEVEAYLFEEIQDSLGLNDAALCGILANAYAESGYQISAVNSSGATGLFQWKGTRWSAKISTTISPYSEYNGQSASTSDIDSQIALLLTELEKTGYRSLLNKLLNVPNTESGAEKAAYYFASEYERFTGSSNWDNAEVKKRRTYAVRLFQGESLS